MKPKLLKQITSNTFESFDKTIKELHNEGYFAGRGRPLFNVWISRDEWKRGCRVINVYDDKSIVFASKVKK